MNSAPSPISKHFPLIALSALSWALSWGVGAILSIILVVAFRWGLGGAWGWEWSFPLAAWIGTALSLALSAALGAIGQLWVLQRRFSQIVLEDYIVAGLGFAVIGALSGGDWIACVLVGGALGIYYIGRRGALLGLMGGVLFAWILEGAWQSLIGWSIGWFVGGLWFMMTLQRALPLFSKMTWVWGTAGWWLGGMVGWGMARYAFLDLGWIPAWTLGGLLAGGIGSSILLTHLASLNDTSDYLN